MTHLEQAICDAVERGGYEPDFARFLWVKGYSTRVRPEPTANERSRILSDPAFYVSLGRARQWPEKLGQPYQTGNGEWTDIMWAEYKNHELVHHLHAKRDVESFFKDL